MNKWERQKQGFCGESDPKIVQALAQTGFKVLLTLSGAGAGLYIASQLSDQRAVYLGPFVGMAAIYSLWRWIMEFLRGQRAKSYEIVRHEKDR